MAKEKMAKSKLNGSRRKTGSIWGGLVQGLAALLIVALGVLGARFLIKMRKPLRRVDPNNLAPLVEAQQLGKRDIQMVIRGNGTVSPKVKVEVVPEVPGKLVYVHPQFKAGGLIRAKEQILQIDPRDYELAVQQANAVVAEAEVRLDTEKAEAQVAREEWKKLHPDTEPTSPLVLRLPQIRRAESALESAKAQLATTKLKLERTSLRLPFDALIISERADLGQYVVVGQSLGVANGIEAVEIEVPLEDEELAWFDILSNPIAPDPNKSPEEYTKAQVKADFAGAEHIWKGHVVRTTGQVDTTSRMVSVVVEVKKPFDTSAGRPPLLAGAFAEVLIQGKTLKGVIAVPRDAVREGNKVWVVDNDCLRIVTLKIARADKDFAYVTSGLDDGTRIVVSSLDVVV
ncbi:MAG: efflux RND transporter periplasmic adaptor subunit, partial [Phycisphaerae bacterium]|nr:efflux RND transporter periplasmic adaptor subunit [Phycisphaerae bacterium]